MSRQNRFVRHVLPPTLSAICMGAVLFFSCQNGETSHDLSMIIANGIADLFTYAGITNQSLEQIDLFVRKSAHFMEYALLSLLLAWVFTSILGRVRLGSLAACIAAISFAGFDEWIQLSFQSRTASPLDVLLDTAGISLGIIAFGFIARKRAANRV